MLPPLATDSTGSTQNATQQAFLAGHELAFAYFGGVFRVLPDNLTLAVKKIPVDTAARRPAA
jgi:transposase